jgi:hypothetical protein
LTTLDTREIVESAPDKGEIRVARVGRRRLDADEERVRTGEVGGVERVADALAVPRQDIRQVRLVEGQPAGPERVDTFCDDVAHDHLVPELGEAAAGDEADPARTEDADRSRFRQDREA